MEDGIKVGILYIRQTQDHRETSLRKKAWDRAEMALRSMCGE
jgi:hypothetical protein